MLFGGMAYLEKERRIAEARGECFEPSANDKIVEIDPSKLPSWGLAVVPIVLVLATIMVPRLIEAGDSELLGFAASQPIFWPCFALILGTLMCFFLFPVTRNNMMGIMSQGMQESVMPLLSTAAVIGFGGVVTQTSGFQDFIGWMASLDLPPLFKLFTSVSLVAAITGSGSGGLQIFMQTMAPAYMDSGISHEILHRITAIAAGGFDSLPHCGAVIAVLTITGLTHRQGYKDVAMVTVVIPVIAALLSIGVASFM
jgi:H+/gluconate symporter-like permease